MQLHALRCAHSNQVKSKGKNPTCGVAGSQACTRKILIKRTTLRRENLADRVETMEIGCKLLDIVRNAERSTVSCAILNERWELRELTGQSLLNVLRKKTQSYESPMARDASSSIPSSCASSMLTPAPRRRMEQIRAWAYCT